MFLRKEKKEKFDWPRFLAFASGTLFIVVASFLVGVIYADQNPWVKATKAGTAEWFGSLKTGEYAKAGSPDFDEQLFWKVWQTIKSNYVDSAKLTDKDMTYGALEGLAASTGDPYTVFMTPSSTLEFQNDMAGSFEGIGAEIGLKNEVITVVAPLDGMPAQKAGIKSGDHIIKINGTSTLGMTVSEAVSKIRGPKSTTVTLTILRDGRKGEIEMKIRRDVIKTKSVKTETKNGVFIIKVSSFNDDTDELFGTAVTQAIAAKPKGIILDLRNNPGGYLTSAITMASYWVDSGAIVKEKYANGQVEEQLASGTARLQSYKTVVLINEGSASASEIVAGALQDYKKATLVGQKSFGKGSVQILHNFSDGSSLKVTAAKWLTPHDRSIDKEGITPDILVPISQKDADAGKDPQLLKALEIISGKKK